MQSSTPVLASIVLAAFLATRCIQHAIAIGCTGYVPNYVALECRISSANDSCFLRSNAEGGAVNFCSGQRPCSVWEGMKLEIRCGGEDVDSSVLQEVYRENSTQGQRNFSWPFATKSAVEGVYMCGRRDDGAVMSNRAVVVEERAQVLPGFSTTSLRQYCIQISPEFECSVAGATYYFTSGAHQVHFNVLGARPTQLNVEAVWTDHYPVDLNLFYPTEVSNSTTLHVVGFTMENLFFVASKSVTIYLAITSSNSYGSSTMCVAVTLFGGPTLFPNESLPEDLAVAEGQPATFACEAKTRDNLATTVAFWVTSSDSHREPVQCLNCSFSPSSLFSCSITVDKGGCLGLSFTNSSYGQELDKTHHLTATWDHVSTAQNGSVVTCAIAVRGMTQWENSATLSVNEAVPTSPLPAPTPTLERKEEALNDVVPISIGAAAAAILFVIAFTVGLLVVVWCFYRKAKSSTNDWMQLQKSPSDDDVQLM